MEEQGKPKPAESIAAATARMAAYARDIRDAQRCWQGNDVAGAMELLHSWLYMYELDGAWESNYLFGISVRKAKSFKGHKDRVQCVSFSPDGKRIVSGSSDNTVKVWDALSGKEVLTFHGHTGAVSTVAFSPNGNSIFSSSSEDRTVKIWDAQTGKEVLCFNYQKVPPRAQEA